MFTGIIENIGIINSIQHDNTNIDFTIASDLSKELRVDQSISHNGVCLTVVSLDDSTYTVTAIKETLNKTNLGKLKLGDSVNLERCLKVGDRLDGHFVQGHVDQIATCKSVVNENGSWLFTFKYDPKNNNITIEKGSITVNGVSLTVVNSKESEFSVAIIPYTYENTNFNSFKVGSLVNLEFDVFGKYITKLHSKA
ncbi:riboflavin synthase [Flavobacteriaceae bacterium]|jgi:riboflavin synthase|nr:riboflavin synthase [Flavobacteriaceae bacterium]MDB4212826.1 riboflavin synthase [Flavobacteriaceae bacterium]MDC0622393.1 riboflavin synthase [Flavobacteriaceae bacterium]MDC1320681.1 riboflavin synthase [Flavobacteriaceae bacterium]|tara:strand:+ start:253 stop:840 length:588 start_codon:yes stop_codon:yes gene_type:complete